MLRESMAAGQKAMKQKLKRPSQLRSLAEPFYYRYQGYQATKSHQPPEKTYERSSTAPDHILCIVIDALRPDHIPNLPLEFTSAISPATWTFPSVTSLQTGLYPHEHGAIAHTMNEEKRHLAVPEQTNATPILPQYLEATGYETYAGCAFMMPFLALQGWYQSHRVYGDACAEQVLSDYKKWRTGRNETFSYLHLGDLHIPVRPPTKYIDERDIDMNLEDIQGFGGYDGTGNRGKDFEKFRTQRLRLSRAALDYVSDQIRDILATFPNTTVVLTGDHGEAFWEHCDVDLDFASSQPNYGVGHGGTPFDMVARVPFGTNTSRLLPRGGWPSLRDLPHTILADVLSSHPKELPGRNWSEEIPQKRAVLCEGVRYGAERKAVYSDQRKLIRSAEHNTTLTATVDPDVPGDTFVPFDQEEINNLAKRLPDSWDSKEGTNASEMVQDQLEALGYT